MASKTEECNRFCGHSKCCKAIAAGKCPGKEIGHCVSRLEAPLTPGIPSKEFISEKLGIITKIAVNA